LTIDGPYIFINGGLVDILNIEYNRETDELEIIKKTLPLPSISDHIITCFIDNTHHQTGMRSFSFEIESHQFSSQEQFEFKQPEKILAVSDIEGNIYALQSILRSNGVIDSECNWTYGENHLVILGDLIDRSNNTLACLWLIFKLDKQAKAFGGAVHYLLGNHELMNFIDDLRYVHAKYKNSIVLPFYKNLFNSSSIIASWIKSKNTIEKIGDYLFVHGGISTKMLDTSLTLAEMNNSMRNIFDKKHVNLLTEREKILAGTDGPLWYRGFFYDSLKQEDITKRASFYGAKKIVVGHTLTPRIKSYFKGKLIAIDIHQPEEPGTDPVHALLIEAGKEYVVDNKGNRKALKNIENSNLKQQ
jgi:hypothetical protein